jgi:hypothetical protein
MLELLSFELIGLSLVGRRYAGAPTELQFVRVGRSQPAGTIELRRESTVREVIHTPATVAVRYQEVTHAGANFGI